MVKLRPISARASANLDMIRGLAALAVLGGHLRSLFYVDYSHVVRKDVLAGAAYFLTSLGHQAVIVFFILSGFLISRSVLGSVGNGRWSWKTYLFNRLTRLLLVLVPGLLLCVCWDQIGMRLPAAPAFYFHAIPHFGGGTIVGRSSPMIFSGNLLFLQSIYFPPFGSDTPLWSLSNEFWYYMLFPLLLLVFLPRLDFARRIGFLLVGIGIAYMIGAPIMVLFPVWLTGAGIGLIHDWLSELVTAHVALPYLYYGGVLGLVASFVAIKVAHGTESDFIVTAAFVPIMCASIVSRDSTVSLAYARLAKYLSSFSYSLYVTHLPLLIFFRTCWGRVPTWQPDLLHVAYGTAIGSIVVTYAFGISRLTEARLDVMREALLRLLSVDNARRSSMSRQYS